MPSTPRRRSTPSYGDPVRFHDVLLLGSTCGVEAGERHHRQHQTCGLQRHTEPRRPALGPMTGDQQHEGSRSRDGERRGQDPGHVATATSITTTAASAAAAATER